MDDGKVTIGTALDNRGIEKDSKKMVETARGQAAKLAAEYRKQGMSLSDAMKKAWAEVKGNSQTATAQIKTDAQKNITGSVSTPMAAERDKVQQILSDMERSWKSKAASIAAIYRKQGLSQSDAMKKAWAQIERSSGVSSKRVGDAIQKNIGGSVDTVTGKFGGLGNVVSKLAKTITSIFAVRAMFNFAADAVGDYADYEQLIGGVETFFKGSAQKVVDYANAAYRTAGMSANEYMQNVTSFSAGLISSLGGDAAKAADIANMALTDMADNANKIGTDMESIQMAYQGFSKQNYTLLDNLKLGYGGTKTEMERLLKDAKKLTGVKYDINNLADVYNAIHAIQEEMGIAGTTAKEAEKTISGSAASMKAAWKNLLTYLSVGGKDLDKAIDNFINSLDTYVDNLMPVVERALVGMGDAAERVIPELVEEFASALVQAAPALLSAVWNSLVGVVKGLFKGLTTLVAGGTVEIIGEQTEAIDGSVDSQNALTGAVKETNKELERSLAGFDEITKLSSGNGGDNAEGVDIQISGGNLSGIKDDSSAIADAWETITSKSKEFFYEVVGDVSVRNVQNLGAAITNLKSGWENFLEVFYGDSGGEGIDAAGLVADIMDFNILLTAGLAKTLGGGLDLIAEYKRHIEETGSANPLDAMFEDADVWDAVGELLSGLGMAATPFHFGKSREVMEALFLPITEEYENLFKGLSAEAAEVLDMFNRAFQQVNRDFRELNWSGEIITEEDVADMEAKLSAITNQATQTNKQAMEAAKAEVQNLLEQGLINEEQAKEATQKLEDEYTYQEKLLEANQTRIMMLMRDAQKKKQKLSKEDQEEILNLLQSSQDKTTAIITQGASDSTDVYEMLRENRGNLTKQMLSEAIQYANEEYKAQKEAAENTYQASIASAEKLYKELGAIDQEEYDRICQEAENKKNAQIDAAVTAREKLVAEAQGAAGDIADAVDPETGEILSNWEVLWNNMYTSVSETWRNIKQTVKDFINDIIDFINKPAVAINDMVGIVGGKTIFGYEFPNISLPTIPKLAQGAVLPANRPFLAMVGDQKHGTNVEAPLGTIQEAVAVVMEDMVASNMAGHEATVAVLKEILSAVLGIEIGDTVIGEAVQRYNAKMAIIRGGAQ